METYIQGDSIAIIVNVSGENINLVDYDINAMFYVKTKPVSLCASTTPDCGELEILRKSATQWIINIASTESSRLPAGNYSLQVTYKHLASESERTFINSIFIIETKKHCNDHNK